MFRQPAITACLAEFAPGEDGVPLTCQNLPVCIELRQSLPHFGLANGRRIGDRPQVQQQAWNGRPIRSEIVRRMCSCHSCQVTTPSQRITVKYFAGSLRYKMLTIPEYRVGACTASMEKHCPEVTIVTAAPLVPVCKCGERRPDCAGCPAHRRLPSTPMRL